MSLSAKGSVHPPWCTEFDPILFFSSSAIAGFPVVSLKGSITHNVSRSRLGHEQHTSHDTFPIGLAKVSAAAMFRCLFAKVTELIHGDVGGCWPRPGEPGMCWTYSGL